MYFLFFFLIADGDEKNIIRTMLALEQARLDFVDGVMKKLQPQSKPSTLAQPSPSSASPDSCNQGVEGFQVIQDDNSSVQSSSSSLVTTPTPTNDTTISKPFLKPDGK